MSYIVLARKWRPRLFEDLVGQEHVSKTLTNAIEMDRLAHAFLFTGVRGVGKTSAARILAMALNCEKHDGPTTQPCGECSSCQRISSASSMDVQEIDGASNNSVDDVRHLRETVAFQPSHSRKKIYIIDEVHMLSTSAFNALLKTLEEPPEHVHFIFATTEPHRIPGTILSRVQRYDFRRIPPASIDAHLGRILAEEDVQMDPEAITMLAREAQGSMRDALSLLDQVLAAFGGKVSLDDVSWLLGVADHRVHSDLSRAVLSRDPGGCLEIVGRLDRDGYNLPHFTAGYLEHVRDLIIVKSVGTNAPGAGLSGGEAASLAALVKDTTLPELFRIFSHVARAADEIARSTMPRVLLEMTFIKLAQNEPLTTIARLLSAVGDLKRSGGLGPAPSGSRGGRTPADPAPRRPAGESAPSAPVKKTRTEPAEEKPQPPQVEKSQPDESTEGQNPAPMLSADRVASMGADELWSNIVQQAGSASPFLHRILEKATPIRVDSDEIRIGFDADSEFDSSFASENDNVRVIRNACEKLMGVRPPVKVESNSQQANEARSARIDRQRERDESLRSNAMGHPVVKEAREMFEAKVRDIKIDVE